MAGSFGELLRAARESAGLSQQELAERAGLTVNGISQLERGVRTRPYPHTVRALADALALDDDARERLLRAVPSRSRGPAAAQPASPSAPKPVPEPPIEVLGRDEELAGVLADLERVRLLTLTGPGGVGKTTLALAVAARVHDRDVVFVPLAAATEAEVALRAIAAAVGLRDAGTGAVAQLQAALTGRQTLLLLDNLEQIEGLGRPVAEVLAAAPELKILATSRAPLGIRWESVRPLTPLRLPDGETADALAAPAVQLLVDRGRAGGPAADPAAAPPEVLAAICRRLDGLPLAIELAAAWLRVLSPAALLDRLEDALPMLAHGPADLPERHRTMRDAIAWSYELLDADHRQLLRALAVLPGSWDLEIAAAVADRPEPDLLRGLAVLVDRSLLQPAAPDARAGMRYRMLETIRAFALEQLTGAGEVTAARDRHAEFMEDLCERAGAGLDGAEQASWLHRLQDHLDDLRAALAWRFEQGADEAAARMYGQLRWLWYLRHCGEGLRWGERALAGGAGLDREVRGRARAAMALVRFATGDLAAARRDASAAVDDAEAVHDSVGLCMALTVEANTAISAGDLDRGRDLAARARRSSDAMADPGARSLIRALATLAQARVAATVGDTTAAQALLTECEPDLDRAGQPWARVFWLNLTILQHQLGGRLEAVPPLLARAFRLCRELDDVPALLYAMFGLSTQLVMTGRPRDAARVLGCLGAVLERSGQQVTDLMTRQLVDAQRAALLEALGESEFAASLADGAGTPLDDLVAALLVVPPRTSPHPQSLLPGGSAADLYLRRG